MGTRQQGTRTPAIVKIEQAIGATGLMGVGFGLLWIALVDAATAPAIALPIGGLAVVAGLASLQSIGTSGQPTEVDDS